MRCNHSGSARRHLVDRWTYLVFRPAAEEQYAVGHGPSTSARKLTAHWRRLLGTLTQLPMHPGRTNHLSKGIVFRASNQRAGRREPRARLYSDNFPITNWMRAYDNWSKVSLNTMVRAFGSLNISSRRTLTIGEGRVECPIVWICMCPTTCRKCLSLVLTRLVACTLRPRFVRRKTLCLAPCTIVVKIYQQTNQEPGGDHPSQGT